MKKIFSTLTVCVAMVSVTNAQDPNFSQFFASPLTLNPAMTGLFDGTFRVAGNYGLLSIMLLLPKPLPLILAFLKTDCRI